MSESNCYIWKGHLTSKLLSMLFPFLKRFSQEQIDTNLIDLKDKNEELNNLEILAGESELNSAPSHLEIEFTNACNLRCFMCFHSSHEIKYVQMGRDSFTGLINRLPYLKTILIAGIGEQLLFQNLLVFLKLAKKYLCKVHLISNGQLINKNLDVFALLSELTVSFDGATKEVFETQRTSSKFKMILSNIKLVRETYPDLKITLGCVVSKLNLSQLTQIMEIAHDFGIASVAFTHVQHAPMIELRQDNSSQLKEQIKKCWELAETYNINLMCSDIENLTLKAESNNITDQTSLISRVNTESEKRKNDTPKDFNGLQNVLSSKRNIFILEQLNSIDLIKKSQHLENHIQILKTKLLNRHKAVTKLPHCLAPWNYGFVKMNGNFRLCPYLNFEDGNISSNTKSIEFNLIRKSLVSRQGMLPVCESCSDNFHRKYKIEALTKVRKNIGLVIQTTS